MEMSVTQTIKRTIRIGLDSSVWRASNRQLVSNGWLDRSKNERAGFTDKDHILAAARWLARAQDSTSDGGVSGRYSLVKGWSSSYPETTGYIIPTLLRLEKFFGNSEYRERAQRCVDFLLSVQLDGPFPGMEIAHNRTKPSVFNSAQIVSGLRVWHSVTGDQRALVALTRACDWLVSQQDDDGVWRKFIYGDVTYTYMAHAACWLAEVGAYLNHQPYLNAAARHLEWVLKHADSATGWIDKCGFSAEDHEARRSVIHTIAYTIWGVLLLSKILKHETGMRVARTAARQVARRLELSRWLPGVLDWRWRPQAEYACLTGNAQMALIWFELNRLQPDPTFVSVACKAIDLIKRAQPMFAKDPGIRGGIAGSDPVWGEYIYAQIPNWAAKFYIDALLDKQEALSLLTLPRPTSPTFPPSIPSTVPSHGPRSTTRPMRVVMYTHPRSQKVQTMVSAWSEWGFRPTAVVVSHESRPGILERLAHKVQEEGVGSIFQKIAGRKPQGNGQRRHSGGQSARHPEVATFCSQRGITVIDVGDLDSPEGIAAVAALQADLAVHAGAGILREKILSLPRLGTLNAHMGVLPHYRGMNVAEWTRLKGDVVGTTVHAIDKGIDTGDILCCRPVAVDSVSSVSELRSKVDEAQVQLLGEVLRYVDATERLPPRRSQQLEEGRQFFAMHPALRTWLDGELKKSAKPNPGCE